MIRKSRGLFITILLVLSLTGFGNAQPELDISFNGTGRVNPDFGVFAAEVLIQADQKMVAVGQSGDATNSSTVFALTRYNTDGSIDTAFGTNGRVLTDFNPNAATEAAFAAALQPDGKIVAAGFVAIFNPGEAYFALARYNVDGSLDQTFGSGGKVTTSVWTHLHHIRGVAIAPDGKIVAAGDYISPSFTTETLIIRLQADGSPDFSFGNAGKVTDVRGFNLGDSNGARGVAVQPDGRIVTCGAFTVNQSSDATLARYHTNGASDFKIVVPSPSVDEIIHAVAIQPDGKIVAVGESGNDFLVLRYTSLGAPDPTFDGDGRVTTPVFSTSKAQSVIIMPNGKLLVSGYSFAAAQGMLFAVYNPDGSLDTTYSGDGKLSFGFPGSFTTHAYGMAVDALNRVVLAGQARDKFALARLYTLEPVPVSVSGRTLTQGGQPIRGITVGLSNALGETRWAITSPFGSFQFDNVPTGQTYTLFVRGAKRHTFPSRDIGLNEAVSDADLIGEQR